MTIVAPTPTRQAFDQEQLRSHLPFLADFRAGNINALSGQTATYVRAGVQTVKTRFEDYDIGANQPQIEWYPAGASGQMLLAPNDETLFYPFPGEARYPIQILIRGYRFSDVTGDVLRIGQTEGPGGSLAKEFVLIQQQNDRYRVSLVDTDVFGTAVTTAQSATVPVNTPFDLVAEIRAVGSSVQAAITVRTTGDYGAFATGATSATFPAFWSSATTYLLSRNGTNRCDTGLYAVGVRYAQGLNDLPWGWA